MAKKILLSLSNPADEENAVQALLGKPWKSERRHPSSCGAGPGEMAREILAGGYDAAVLDYLAEDACSVKLAQAVSDAEEAARLIFVADPAIGAEQVMMAMNEGAFALLPSPLDSRRLEVCLGRALNGPGRLRGGTPSREDTGGLDIEETLQVLKRINNGYQKLIPLLLAKPVSEQWRRVLIVSDSPYQVDILRKRMEDFGFKVSTAANAEEGVAAAMADKPLIVVSDLELEGKNGIEFCRELKIVQKFIPCHFVICTASTDKAARVMTPGNGVDDCVLKPSAAESLDGLIARIAIGLTLRA